MHMLHGDSSDVENSEIYAAEFVWSSSDKPSTCASLKPIPKNRHDEIKYTFDVTKCDRILMSWQSLRRLNSLTLFHR